MQLFGSGRCRAACDWLVRRCVLGSHQSGLVLLHHTWLSEMAPPAVKQRQTHLLFALCRGLVHALCLSCGRCRGEGTSMHLLLWCRVRSRGSLLCCAAAKLVMWAKWNVSVAHASDKVLIVDCSCVYVLKGLSRACAIASHCQANNPTCTTGFREQQRFSGLRSARVLLGPACVDTRLTHK